MKYGYRERSHVCDLLMLLSVLRLWRSFGQTMLSSDATVRPRLFFCFSAYRIRSPTDFSDTFDYSYVFAEPSLAPQS
uniref:Putative secreted protein n=1 Tax=Ixodes ricinus TaxID=34613 RepID=A0A6B0U037_IXORI